MDIIGTQSTEEHEMNYLHEYKRFYDLDLFYVWALSQGYDSWYNLKTAHPKCEIC